MQNIDEIIDDFKAHKWQAKRLSERVCELQTNKMQTLKFCERYLHEFEQGSTIFADSLSYVSPEGLTQLVQIGMQMLSCGKVSETVKELVEHVSLQAPQLLHSYLELLFKHRINSGKYYEFYPWCGIGDELVDKFTQLARQSVDRDERKRLVRALMASGNVGAAKFAYDLSRQQGLYETYELNYMLADSGWILDGEQLRSYYTERTYHIIFPCGYFTPSKQVWLARDKHPTWLLEGSNLSYKFGGLIAADESDPFMHLITLDPVPAGLGVTRLSRLVLGAHVREMNDGWGVVCYRHDEWGEPVKIGLKCEVSDSLDEPAASCQITLAPTPLRWLRQSWGSSNGRENLFRLGGKPSWVQRANVPECACCGRQMSFLIQLDTGLPDAQGGELFFGSGGMMYGFWCDECKVSAYLMQWT